jgi:regulatory protein
VARPRKPNSELTPKARAVRLLARREHSARELSRKLVERGIDEAAAASVVRDLAADGWQSDQRYAESLLRQRVMQGYGPLRISAELEAAGVARELAAAVLEAADCDWAEQCRQAHLRRFDTPAGAREWHKQYAYLQGRGFTPDQIYAALKSQPVE